MILIPPVEWMEWTIGMAQKLVVNYQQTYILTE